MRQRLGRRSLHADAAYCAASGVMLIGVRRLVASRLTLTPNAVGLAGLATLVWAGVVAGLGRRGQRRELCAVGFANIGAAAALIGASRRHSSEIGGRLLLAAGLEVATIAGSQALALGLSEKRAA